MDPSEIKDATNVQHVEGGLDKSKPHGSHIEGNALLIDGEGKVRKIPLPSSDPNDPLNWRPWEKYGLVFCCCWFSVMGLAMASGLGAILNVFFEMYTPLGYSSEQVVFLITLPTLCIGLGNLLILPLGLAYGRRPVFLISMVLLLGATVAAAVQNSYDGHLAARVIQGLTTGASESLLPLMLTEITFLHERPLIFGIYWMVQNVLSSMINLTSSYLNHDLGWRWYYWVFVITVSVGLVIAYIFAAETQFIRSAQSLDGRVVITDEFGTTRIVPDSEAQAYLSAMQQHGSSQPETSPVGQEVPRKTFFERTKPWSTPHRQPIKVILMSWLHMAISLTSPGILYAVLTSSIVLGCAVGMSLTYNEVLMVNYGWQPQDIGLINVGGMIGAFLGMLYCSFLGNLFVLWLARRNRGVHEPEHQLLTLVPPAVIGFAMLLLYGFTAQGGTSWWGPYLAWTVFQYSFTAVVIISTTFASEAAPKHPGPALVVVVGSKNIISFGVTYGLTPMITRHGYEWAFGVLSGIFSAIFLLGIPVYLFNPRWRAYAASKEGRHGVVTTD